MSDNSYGHILGQPGLREALMRMSTERLRRTSRLLADRAYQAMP